MSILKHLRHATFLLSALFLIFSNGLAQPPAPAEAPSREARIEKLKAEYAQAEKSNDGDALLRALVPLTEFLKGTPDWGVWQRRLVWREYHYGSQNRAIELGEEFVAKQDMPPMTYSRGVSELAWMYFDINRVREGIVTLAKAEAAFSALPSTILPAQRAALEASLIAARGYGFWRSGDLETSSSTLRRGLALAMQAAVETAGKASSSESNSEIYSRASGEMYRLAGLLLYALLREGKVAEAHAIAEEWLVRAKAGSLDRNQYAVWQRRLGSTLAAQRKFEEALAAVRAGFGEQQQMGAEDTSHNATIGYNLEIRALVGLQRWADADTTYKQYRDAARGDSVALQRASNAPLESIVAAKNGRVDDALRRIEGSIRSRTRLYGASHYLTRESRGIRGAVQLIGGAADSALRDYEELFTVLLDTPSGWTDLSPTGEIGRAHV